MLRHLSVASAAVWLCVSALGQQSLRSRLAPITAPIRHAGVYHLATGTWTRNASLANVTGPDIIYNNTCAAGYFVAQQVTGEKIQHRSRIPSTSGPTTPSVFYPTTGQLDEAPGCHDAYVINGFEFAYCSSAVTTVGFLQEFANSYTQCGAADMVPDYSFTLTGLPGGKTGGTRACWLVDVDLSGNPGGGILLSADGDGTYVGPSTAEQFGWSVGPAGILNPADLTGPIVAGDFTNTFIGGVLMPCTGTDGTIWDNPINLSEEGTGMASNDFFRITAPNPGCYDFGGNPHADFYLKLYADPQCPAGPLLTEFCFPGEGGIRACTICSPANTPSVHGRGCDNYGQHTGGAQLSMTGLARIVHDTVVFTSQFENNTSFTVLMQGTTTTNLVFGAGIRCVGGNLKRLYTGPAGSAANGDPPGTIHRPGPVDSRSAHQASLDVGYDIAANVPITLYYQAQYRDPNASPYCGGATFNASVAGSLNWVP